MIQIQSISPSTTTRSSGQNISTIISQSQQNIPNLRYSMKLSPTKQQQLTNNNNNK